MQIPLIKGDKVDNNVDYRDALPVNMYAINREVLGTNGYMINFFGLSDYTDGVNKDRGAIWVSRPAIEGHYRVSGSSLLLVDQFGNTTDLGTIPGSLQVSMAYSFNNLAIVADGKLYYYNTGQGLREITDADVGSPIDIEWINSKFILTDGESIYTSNVTNEELYESLDFANAEFMPDSSRGVSKNEDNEIMVFGDFSTEYFLDVAADNFPLQRIPGKAQKIGILGTHCKAEMNGRFYTLSRRKETSPSFHIISLGDERSISTRETDKILATYTEMELETTTIDAVVIDNVKMVIYHLPNDTLMFNESVADTLGVDYAWSILKTDVTGEETFRAKNFIRDPRNAKWLVGDKRDGRIGELDKSVATHYSEIVEWILFTPFVKLDSKSIDKLEVETIPGVTASNVAPPDIIEFANMNFTRSSVATVVNQSGVLSNLGIDVPAFKSTGFYPEGEATNLTTFSEDLAQWGKDPLASLVSEGIGPDGISVPLKFTTDIGSSVSWDWGPTATVSFVSGEDYTFSFFAKDNGGQFIAINLPDSRFGSNSDVGFDLVNGVIFNNQGGKQAEIEELFGAPGWFRISLTLRCISSGSSTADLIAIIGGGTSLTSTGDGTGFFSYGAQTKLRDYKSKYMRTTGSTATRADEICTVLASEFLPNAKDNFTIVTNVFIERLSGSTADADRQTIFNSLDDTNLNLFISDDDITFFSGNVGDGQGTYGVTASSALTTGNHEIIVLRRLSTSIEIWLDGVMVAQNTSNIAPIEADYTTELSRIGSRVASNDRFLNIPTNNMSIYKRALSSVEIVEGDFSDANVKIPLTDNLKYEKNLSADDPTVILTDDATVGVSLTVDGRMYSNEFFQLYGEKNDYNTRFYIRRLGYVRNVIGIKLRGASRSRMAFSNLTIEAS